MKALNKVLLALCLLGNFTLLAQKPQIGCVDATVEAQAIGIKLGLSKKGMSVFQEAMFKMQSMEPVPIAVKLAQGVNYELVFVGSENANRLTMEIFDGKDKKLDEKIERSMNNIVYSFTPKQTDVYLITLYQKKGVKDMCGYFAVMMKGAARPATPVKKEQTPAKPATVKTPAATPAQPAQKTNNKQAVPGNQQPNPNRTKATREAQQQKNK
ncbi:MAG TPA: hypothetical protein PL009_08375 [Flavipsychrobacter sp.]|nr:hypothetical protein [Flavipsychrobacter sp.]